MIMHTVRSLLWYWRGWLVMLMLAAGLHCAHATVQWLFKDPCGAGLVPNALSPIQLPGSSGKAECATMCGQDATCLAFSASPCTLYGQLASGCLTQGTGTPNILIKYYRVESDVTWCPVTFDFSDVTGSCYLYEDVSQHVTWFQVKQLCGGYGAHMLALDSAIEHNFIKSYMAVDKNGACSGLWTGGVGDVPGSRTEWSWHLVGDKSRKITYFAWYGNEPNNKAGLENYLMLIPQYGYKYNDLAANISGVNWGPLLKPCFICELSP